MLLFSWTSPGRRGARRVPCGRAISTMSARRARSACRTRQIIVRHVAAERERWRRSLSCRLHPQRLDHDADLARLSRFRPAARLKPSLGELLAAGQGQPAGAVARHHLVRRCKGAHADLLTFVGEAVRRRLRPAQGNRVSLLEIRDLSVSFAGWRGAVRPVAGREAHFRSRLDKGETLALVGESGSGKSVTALSVLQFYLPYPAASHTPGKQHQVRRRGAGSARRRCGCATFRVATASAWRSRSR